MRQADLPLAKRLGEQARALRQRLGATQEEVAEKASMSVQVYSRLERGLVLPGLATFVRLCGALKARPDELLNVDSPPTPGRAQQGGAAARPEALRLLRMLEGSETQALKAMTALAKALRKQRR